MAITLTSQYRCPICDHRSSHVRPAGGKSFEAVDLDLRPSAHFRGPLDQWLVECPQCAYVSNGDDHRPEHGVARWRTRHGPWITREKLINITLAPIVADLPAVADRFMRRSRIDEELNRPWLASYHALSAAWCCDDESKGTLAVTCRLRAAGLIRSELSGSHPGGGSATLRMVLVDVLRRAGRFAEARSEAEWLFDRGTGTPVESAILRYQVALIDHEVRGRETIAAALG